MQAIRPGLRRSCRSLFVPRTIWFSRAQHDFHGPHKEYFQNPGQTPLPDTTPYVQLGSSVPNPASPPTPTKKGRSIASRAARSIFWATLFGSFGLAAGTALITWEYMQPPFEPGSEEEQDLYDEILETLETSALVESLKEEQWIEENFYNERVKTPGATGLHLVKEHLTGTQGITMKTFKHPSQKYTMMVFFLGFGIEGWPDVVHGGIITTLLQEGIDRHVHNFYQELGRQDSQFISVDFKKPTRPGTIYAVIVPPGAIESDIFGRVQLHFYPMLMQMEVAPKVQSVYDAASNTEQVTIEIPTTSGEDITHAAAAVRVRMVRNDKQGPSRDALAADETT